MATQFDNDVHTHTAAVRGFLDSLHPQIREMLYMEFCNDDLLAEACLALGEGDDAVSQVLDKMLTRGRSADGQHSYLDPDLGGVNILCVLVYTYYWARRRNALPEMKETLRECAQHCPQGDSHRLLYLLFALVP